MRNGQIASAGNIGFGQFGDEETFGFGVRVIHSGWGFASSPVVDPAEINRVVAQAADVARPAPSQNASTSARAGEDADTFWQTPIKVDPWTIPLEDKVKEPWPSPRSCRRPMASSWRRRR